MTETTARADGGGRPLAGDPLTVKDWIDVVGLPCRGATADVPDRAPRRDATVVARLRRAGAIVVAKTLAGPCRPLFGCCWHPHDPARSPGGSSSGEAALLGADASVLGVGSDSGGGIRLAAAWCGVVGLKPSSGLVPDTGHFPGVGPHADGRTVIGPLAQRVIDVAAVLPVLAGPDEADPGCVAVPLGAPATVPARGLRVAVLEDEAAWRQAASTAAAVHHALDVLVAWARSCR